MESFHYLQWVMDQVKSNLLKITLEICGRAGNWNPPQVSVQCLNNKTNYLLSELAFQQTLTA